MLAPLIAIWQRLARDENTWGFHLLETMEQGLNPEYG